MAYTPALRHARAGNGFFDRIAGFFGSLGERWSHYRLYRETVDELSLLDARELADLGMSRTEIRAVAHRAVYGA